MNLSIDFGALKTASANIRNEAGNFSALLSKITATSNDLQWTGADATSYINALKEQEAEMNKLTKSMEEIATFLDTVAQAYLDVSEANRIV